jgi:hypothetical protein
VHERIGSAAGDAVKREPEADLILAAGAFIIVMAGLVRATRRGTVPA